MPTYDPKPPAARPEDSPKKRVRRIVRAYRWDLGTPLHPLSFARFAAALNQAAAPSGLSITYQSIKNWEDGLYLPNHAFILRLSLCAPAGSWERAFALDLLAAQWPELYGPGSEIRKQVLKTTGL